MTRNYYCLVAGLPDIVMEERKMAFSSLLFRDMLQEDLHPQDYRLVKLFFLPFDHQNVLNRLFVHKNYHDERGNYSYYEIDAATDKKTFELAEKTDLPDYLHNFLKDYFEGDERPKLVDAERTLTTHYFTLLSEEKNSFVRQYAQFELNLRNILLALNGRKYDQNVSSEFIGDNEVVQALIKSRARDFGLATEVDNIETLLQIHEGADMLERELRIDMLRWQFLEESTFFNYFTIEKILAFTLKLFMVERWYHLDEAKGRELFNKLLKELETSYEFPEEFKLSHGKKK
ncbi:DUF2764 family protein [Marinilabiliaceae bacterium JC017]|nr:DUF2764 family protein [Marinilabiliaceae bacterium JC017]